MGTASKQEVPEAGRRHSPTPIRCSLRSILDDHNACSVSGHMRKATEAKAVLVPPTGAQGPPENSLRSVSPPP